MKLLFACLLATVLQLTAGSAASAAPRGHHSHRHELRVAHQYGSYHHVEYGSSRRVADGRPSAWCGWEMRQLVGGNPGPEYNLARNWAHWGRPASGPAPGVIGVMPHHVFKVVQVLGRGSVLAISGNDGHAVRVRPRSTAGVIAWREG
jgi:hypothetical protein